MVVMTHFCIIKTEQNVSSIKNNSEILRKTSFNQFSRSFLSADLSRGRLGGGMSTFCKLVFNRFTSADASADLSDCFWLHFYILAFFDNFWLHESGSAVSS